MVQRKIEMRLYFQIQIILIIGYMVLLPLNLEAQKNIMSKPFDLNHSADPKLYKKSRIPKSLLDDDLQEIIKRNYHPQSLHDFIVRPETIFYNLTKLPLTESLLDSFIIYGDGWKAKLSLTYNDKGKRLIYLSESQDSITTAWIKNYRYTYAYDNAGNMLRESHENWNDTLNIWVEEIRYTYTYDDRGNMLTKLHEEWDNAGNQWIYWGRNTYTYDSSGNMLTRLIESFVHDTDTWRDHMRYSYTYDSVGNILSEIVEHWDYIVGQLVYFRRNYFMYDDIGNIVTEIIDYWSEENWERRYRISFTSGSDGNILYRYFDFWKSDEGIWLSGYRNTYVYDDSENMLSELEEQWVDSTNTWLGNWRYSYTYDSHNNKLTELSEDWDNSMGSWVGKWRYAHTYDSSDNMLSKLREEWNSDTEVWENHWRQIFNNDDSGNLIHCKSESWSGSDWIPSSVFCEFSNSGYNYRILCREFFGYYSTVTDVEYSENNVLNTFYLSQNYPNPFNPLTTIEFHIPHTTNVKLEIYNTLGQRIQTLLNKHLIVGQYEIEFNAEIYSSGVYFYKIDAGEYQDIKKMILLK